MIGRRLPAILGAALLAFAGCASGFDGDGRFLNTAGGQVHLWCDGVDGPSVVFLSAIGGDDTMVPIASRIADAAVACFYHRPGHGDTAFWTTCRWPARLMPPPHPDQPQSPRSD
jgi:hypothetical protein